MKHILSNKDENLAQAITHIYIPLAHIVVEALLSYNIKR